LVRLGGQAGRSVDEDTNKAAAEDPMRRIPLIAAFVALVTALVQAPARADSATPAPAPALTSSDVEAWLDGFMPYALQQGDIAGAVVAVVKDGAILTQRGYGYADVAARKPMDPAQTLIRPGSVSKLFTWTAVMQLVEQGKLDLDADVNGYLDFQIPARHGKPVTLRNILTHTAGFEEQLKGIIGVEADGAPQLEGLLKRWTPERIFAPGEVPAYSNYATALAGYIVQRVSGMPFDDYIEAYLFAPLQMQRSTFRQPLPEAFRPHMSKGYVAASLSERPFEIVGPAPAGSLSATAADMANFMIAHLQQGRFGDRQILEPETAQLMHGTALTIMPRVNRMLLGFYETNYNGRRAIAHGGDTQWFHSDLHLFIDDGVGIFLSLNSAGAEGATAPLRSALYEQFADRYLPPLNSGPPEAKVDSQTALEHARLIAGRYTNSRRAESSFLSVLNLVSDVVVTDNGDGTIGVSMVRSSSGVPLRWREIEPFVWQQEYGKKLLAAQVVDGRIAQFSFEDISPFMTFLPAAPWKAAVWLLPAFVVALLALCMTSVAWPVSALTRRHYGRQYPLQGPDASAHGWVRIAAVATVVTWVAWAVTVSSMMSNLALLSSKLDPWVWVLRLVAVLVFIGGAAAGSWNAWVVLRSQRRWYAKAWAVVLALALLVSLWVALAYNVLTSGMGY
jgi:CubicO group peptidase (beta-lactamase class C family)